LITWLASYPKSGNTYLRLLLNAYLCNGNIDINNLVFGGGDHRKYYYQVVSPLPLTKLNREDILLLRNAALMNMSVGSFQKPCLIKTHNINGIANDIKLIPNNLTEQAFYIVRDPRNVVVSFARHMKLSIDDSIDCMDDRLYSISNDNRFFHVLGNWSENVTSWLNAEFKVNLIKYERLVSNTREVLENVLKALGIDINNELLDNAIKATSLDKLRDQESKGFEEKPNNDFQFFNGSTDYEKDLTREQIKRIEDDHGQVMEMLGYAATR